MPTTTLATKMSRVDSASQLVERVHSSTRLPALVHPHSHLGLASGSVGSSRCASRDASPERNDRHSRGGLPPRAHPHSASYPHTPLSGYSGTRLHNTVSPMEPASPLVEPEVPSPSPALGAVGIVMERADSAEEWMDAPLALGSRDEVPPTLLRTRSQLAEAAARLPTEPLLMELIDASVNPRASLDCAKLPVAPTNPFGLGTSGGLAPRTSTSGRTSESGASMLSAMLPEWLSVKLRQFQRTRWILTGGSVLWLLLNIHSVVVLDLGDQADTAKTLLDVLMNGPQMAQVVKDLSQVGLALLLTLAQGKAD